jgi:hypothetical protein
VRLLSRDKELGVLALGVQRVLCRPGCYADLRREMSTFAQEAGCEVCIIIPFSMKG